MFFTITFVTVIFHRLDDLEEQLESGDFKENISQLKCKKYREEFEKFANELFINLNEDL